MTRLLIALCLALLFAIPALAAPGDPRFLQGTVEWPGALTGEPVMIVRGDDGRVYVADVGSARRHTLLKLRWEAGEAVGGHAQRLEPLEGEGQSGPGFTLRDLRAWRCGEEGGNETPQKLAPIAAIVNARENERADVRRRAGIENRGLNVVELQTDG